MANKKTTKEKKTVQNENIDDGSLFYDNTAGTIFSADSDAETGSNKEAERQSKKSKKNKKNNKPAKNRKPLIVGGVILAIAVALIGTYFAVQKFVPDEVDTTSPTYPTDENGEQYATDLKGNKINSEKDLNGNILVAGIEELISHVPADIKKVKVTNEHGSFEILSETPTEKSTDAEGKEVVTTLQTVYTLVGYEDAPLAPGRPDDVANDAAAVKTTNIVDITGKNPEEYGLTKPRATVDVTFTNGNERTITVGNEAPGAAGAYIMVNGDKAIYLVAVESVDSFLYKQSAMFDTTVTTAAEDTTTATPKKVTISGSNFKDTLEFVPNDDETVGGAYYKMTAPTKGFASVANGSVVLESIRSVSAEEAIAYNPSTDTLKANGIDLDNPYAELNAEFSDVTIHLYASAPYEQEVTDEITGEAKVNNMIKLYNPDTKTLYIINALKTAWATTSYEAMKYEYVMKPDMDFIKNIEITAGNKKYSFDLSKETNVDSEGNETKSTVVNCGKTKIDINKFDTFFINLESAEVNSVKSGTGAGTADLTVKITYNNDKTADTYTFYKGESGKYNFSDNGTTISGDVFDTYVKSIIEDVALIAQNKTVDPI